MANKVWNKSSEAPIIRTVLKQIHYWHCIVRETMYKQCFEHTFCIMEWPTVGSNSEKTKIKIRVIRIGMTFTYAIGKEHIFDDKPLFDNGNSHV